MKYEFSTPMPGSVETILELARLNNEVDKSAITSVYYALHGMCKDKTGFEQNRVTYQKEDTFEDYLPLIEKVKEVDEGFYSNTAAAI